MPRELTITGQVQGVGFRPLVWRIARAQGLSGDVRNTADGVAIRLDVADTAPFLAALRRALPPLARIDAVTERALDRLDAGDFTILPSTGGAIRTAVTPDQATCPDCLAEIFDPTQRRQGYAFTNCTNCGPRFSIITGLPYDRPRTAMAAFSLCADCQAEYDDPADRRFHAQPLCCPACGPQLSLEPGTGGDPIAETAARLKAGEIVAIKGIGGFHLAVDALNPDAIARLRTRKRRPTKPLAVMGTRPMVAAHSELTAEAEALLTSGAAPIVLLPDGPAPLPDLLAPDQHQTGWMLPYTPLHHLLLDAFGGPLVMTSANLSGQPQVIGNDEARESLAGIADAILLHDRAITRRLDDSVIRLTKAGPLPFRHARGRAPEAFALPEGFDDVPDILALGGELKSAICLITGGRAMLSQHLGDLDTLATYEAFQQAIADYTDLMDHHPVALACDAHPDFRATAHAREIGGERPVIEVQHHHAHLAACLADADWPRDGGRVAGIVLDGLGLGPDGTIWGGELLLGDYRDATRLAHLKPVPLFGGDAAQREPWRVLAAHLDAAGLDAEADRLFPDKPLALLRRSQAPLTSSMGRLFDAVACLLGLAPERQSFEGEAAMALEAAAAPHLEVALAAPDRFPAAGGGFDPGPFLAELMTVRDADPGPLAARFHAAVARTFCAAARAEVEAGRAAAVALTGGCFQNAVLLDACMAELDGLPVLHHARVPPNDGSLALGQALVAAARLPEDH